MSGDGGDVAASLRSLGCSVDAAADGGLVVCWRDPAWLHDVLECLGHGVWREGDRVHVVAHADRERLAHAVRAALAPQALLLDLDGVLADIEGRKPLASVPVVQELAARWPLGVVTSCPRRLAESVLARHGFLPFVRTVVCEEDGPGKPDPFPVRLALQRLGVATAWMVGDNPSDATAARTAGVVPLAIAPHGIGAESHAERLRAAGAVRLLALADVLGLAR
ncbi:MAG: HAD family hydrolase [Planctomycetes bacterium]|nr:HAD family hydrolase [Planctomycetota bacterium]